MAAAASEQSLDALIKSDASPSSATSSISVQCTLSDRSLSGDISDVSSNDCLATGQSQQREEPSSSEMNHGLSNGPACPRQSLPFTLVDAGTSSEGMNSDISQEIVSELLLRNEELRNRLTQHNVFEIPTELDKDRLFELHFFNALPPHKRAEIQSILSTCVSEQAESMLSHTRASSPPERLQENSFHSNGASEAASSTSGGHSSSLLSSHSGSTDKTSIRADAVPKPKRPGPKPLQRPRDHSSKDKLESFFKALTKRSRSVAGTLFCRVPFCLDDTRSHELEVTSNSNLALDSSLSNNIKVSPAELADFLQGRSGSVAESMIDLERSVTFDFDPMSSDAESSSEIYLREEACASDGDVDGEDEVPALDVSGVPGCIPEDHFAITVKTRPLSIVAKRPSSDMSPASSISLADARRKRQRLLPLTDREIVEESIRELPHRTRQLRFDDGDHASPGNAMYYADESSTCSDDDEYEKRHYCYRQRDIPLLDYIQSLQDSSNVWAPGALGSSESCTPARLYSPGLGATFTRRQRASPKKLYSMEHALMRSGWLGGGSTEPLIDLSEAIDVF